MGKTYVAELYDYFLSNIEDYEYLRVDITDEDIKDELDGYFKKARVKFYKCKQRLDTLVDENGEEYFGYLDEKGKVVEVELTGFELLILSHLMVVEYLKPKALLNSQILKPTSSDRTLKIYSQANHLSEVNLLYRLFQKESNKMITEYTYMDLGDAKL